MEGTVKIISIDNQSLYEPIKAIVYHDPLNTVSANMGATHSKSEKMKYIKGIEELLSFGAPRFVLEQVYSELYCGKSPETGTNAVNGLLTMDMFCNRKTLKLHKDDPRRVGTFGYDVAGARHLERWERELRERERQMRATLLQTQKARGAAEAVELNGQVL
jgi:hypothetical protein